MLKYKIQILEKDFSVRKIMVEKTGLLYNLIVGYTYMI